MALKRNQLELYNTIDKILWEDWDPLGVNEVEDVRDEYQSYTPAIFNLKNSGADVETIASKLYEIESKQMGYDQGYEGCKQVAEKIYNL